MVVLKGREWHGAWCRTVSNDFHVSHSEGTKLDIVALRVDFHVERACYSHSIEVRRSVQHRCLEFSLAQLANCVGGEVNVSGLGNCHSLATILGISEVEHPVSAITELRTQLTSSSTSLCHNSVHYLTTFQCKRVRRDRVHIMMRIMSILRQVPVIAYQGSAVLELERITELVRQSLNRIAKMANTVEMRRITLY